MIRSQGGWAAIKSLKKAGSHLKSDERILGDSAFVEKVLAQSQEAAERRSVLQSKGLSMDDIADRVAHLLGMDPNEVWLPGKYRRQVRARSLLCYFAVREYGFNMTTLAKRLGISTAAVSKAVQRGADIAGKNGYAIS